MERMRHVRSTIWRRRYEDRQAELRIEEIKLQILASAIHAAAGNKAGVKGAQHIRLTDGDEPAAALPSVNKMLGMIGASGSSDLISVTGLGDS